MMLYSNLEIKNGHLCIAGFDACDLAEKYGTPLFILDENRVRENCKAYLTATEKYFGKGSRVCYASKALSYTGIYRTIKSVGMYTDIVSSGELYTALNAGFDAANALFHGNNKTDADIEYGISSGIGYFVIDNLDELYAVDRIAQKHGIVQNALLRITPGIDPHTHKAVITGNVDSKFGSAIETEQAEEITVAALGAKNISLKGFHCHIGSQIFEAEPFCSAADIMLGFIADMKRKHGFSAEILNLGGGFGVPYVETQPKLDIEENIREISEHIKTSCAKLCINRPDIFLEPGRSIVADCCITLYAVGSVKEIRGYKNYVSVDGGMTDNPRYALYASEYTVLVANKADKPADFLCTVAGRCCESGDIIQENIRIAECKRGDLLAVLCTGAYNYSMASNYNRIPRPAIVTLYGGMDKLSVKRESFEEIVQNDE